MGGWAHIAPAECMCNKVWSLSEICRNLLSRVVLVHQIGGFCSVAGPEMEASAEATARARLVDLFYAMDSDLNGMLDVEEFRQAMRAAKRELPGDVVSKVLDAMDIHGRLTLDQFISIVEVRTAQPSWFGMCCQVLHST